MFPLFLFFAHCQKVTCNDIRVSIVSECMLDTTVLAVGNVGPATNGWYKLNRKDSLNVIEDLCTTADYRLGKLLSIVGASGLWSFRVSRASALMTLLFT
jgi:hypothetical protein